jgi:RNA polymerase sigma-70 factor, ECF subfamily
MTAVRSLELDSLLEQHRVELTGYCYRMLGSAFEADDAVQETLLRAWRNLDRFEGRAAVRTWLYRIATNVCLDMLADRRRRARPMDLGPPSPAEAVAATAALPEHHWIQPIRDGLVLPEGGDPAETVVARETIRLAFVAALQHLPPRQRAVLILHEVLRWRAKEVAELLDTSAASVRSALQRARATLAAREITPADPVRPQDPAQRLLLERYVAAFERSDIAALVSLLHEDATVSMPPYPLWLQGLDDIVRWIRSDPCPLGTPRFLPTVANGSPAFGLYQPTGPGGAHEPAGIEVIELSAGRIIGKHAFLDARLVPLFGLPSQLAP